MLAPYLIAGGLAVSVVTGGYGYFKGRADANANCEARVQAMLAEAQRAKDAEAAKAAAAATTLETKNAEARVVYRTITRRVDRLVDRPVYRNLCLDTDGLFLANAALAGASVAPGVADQPVPLSKPPN